MTTDTIGDTSNTTGNYGQLMGYPVVASASGTLTSVGINIYNAGGGGTVMVAIYSTMDGTPKFTGLLGQGEADVASGWLDIPISGNVSIVQGNTYYICYQVSAAATSNYVNFSTGVQKYLSQSYATFTDPTGTLSDAGASTANMRIIYTVTGTPYTHTITDMFGL
jgi:hypothetical protein